MGLPLHVETVVSSSFSWKEARETSGASYKIQNPDLAHTRDMLDSLLEIFQSLEKTLLDREFLADEQDLVKNIETSIKNCDDLIYEMQDEVQKFDKISPEEIVAIIKFLCICQCIVKQIV